MYSRLLVALQFGLIGVMLVLGRGIVNSPAGLALFAVGAAVGVWALAHNRLGNFNIRPDLREGCVMVNSGPYRYVRHPMYTSVLTMMAGVVVATPTVCEAVFFAALFVVLSLKALREERLWCEHHDGYVRYKRTTKMFVPWVW